MEFKERVEAALWPRLIRSGWLPDGDSYRAHRIRREQLGHVRLAAIREELGCDPVGAFRAEDLPPLSEYDLVRVLGFGHLATDYLTASLLPAGQAPASWPALGALSNLIVSLFDLMVDSGLGGPPLEQFGRWIAARCAGDKPEAVRLPAPLALIRRLVELYFRSLRLAAPRAVVADTSRCVWAMYEAEIASLGPAPSPRAVRRKNVLPFLVAALPAWAAAPAARRQGFLPFAKGVYHFGTFIGLIDDVADFEHDRREGQANSLAGRLPETPDQSELAERAADALYRCLQRLIRPGQAPNLDRPRSGQPAEVPLFPVAALMTWWDIPYHKAMGPNGPSYPGTSPEGKRIRGFL